MMNPQRNTETNITWLQEICTVHQLQGCFWKPSARDLPLDKKNRTLEVKDFAHLSALEYFHMLGNTSGQ